MQQNIGELTIIETEGETRIKNQIRTIVLG